MTHAPGVGGGGAQLHWWQRERGGGKRRWHLFVGGAPPHSGGACAPTCIPYALLLILHTVDNFQGAWKH